ncbi:MULTISPECIES: CocE/NonD family hydrolase [unclassified Nocardioides]|uniref:CocE/NonD family hydrolase n=1 Tax=unclassified Nocardioides TaxID=2615069 RepID=UPI0006F55E71|nr:MULTISPECIES: CocE/NonD family hydrolase [unclassified Nocardioides]KRA31041.1 ABC transporter ATP-binding protein [Nocardioides sp. Root614]KRA87662.1 ABC transporter ATP-binding protein [Nocardioides sp. Root682]
MAFAPTGVADQDETFTQQTLHFKVTTGPDDKVCDIVGDVYIPAAASRSNRVPAILITNGFGGSKDGRAEAGISKAFAQRGYVVLSYSGLGFGGSDCAITLDHPAYDGKAGSQLISYLGGAPGIAYADDAHTQPAPPLDVVIIDSADRDGVVRQNDPRVGMAGGSYGGQIQFAVASVDPRLDTITPMVTWNDLDYSFNPNGIDRSSNPKATPGALKLVWGLGFTAMGVTRGVENAATDPGRLFPCPNFTTFVCPALVTAAALGYFQPKDVALLRGSSVASYIDKVKIPTLLMQGQKDTLFNLNEAIATYEALAAQGTEVKMMWQSWGHSNEDPAPGEIDLDALDPATQYQTGRVANWFDHYLKGKKVSTGPEFAYFRDWVEYDGNAAPAYGTASSYPVGKAKEFYLSGTSLTTSSNDLARRSQYLVTAPAGLPTNLAALETISVFADVPVPELDLPGTAIHWDTDPLAANLDVVGSPKLDLQVSSPTAALTQNLGPTGQLVLFARLQDVAPDGTATDIHLLTTPVRIPDVRAPFTVTMPAFVHRFAVGHRVRLVVAASSVNYRGGMTVNTVSVASGSENQALKLPVVP